MLVLAAALAASVTAIPSSHKEPKPHFNWATTKHLIAFGDSYTYVQGTTGRQNFSFIGDNFHLAFTPSELLANRIVQNLTGTAEGGPNWVERLTNCGTAPGLTNPSDCKTQLWDFAYAGADTINDPDFTPLHHPETVALEVQIEQFEKYGDPALVVSTRTIKKRTDALVAFWIGINDINDLAKLRGRNASFPPLYERVQKRQFELVQRVYDLGYRNFLFMNLPPLDRGPSAGVNATMVSSFNSILKSHARAFERAHRDATVLQFDVNKVLNGVLDEYRKYGFKNVTGYCPGYNQPEILSDPGTYGCAPLETYFWYNSGHLTSRTHEIFTKELVKFLGRSKMEGGKNGGW